MELEAELKRSGVFFSKNRSRVMILFASLCAIVHLSCHSFKTNSIAICLVLVERRATLLIGLFSYIFLAETKTMKRTLLLRKSGILPSEIYNDSIEITIFWNAHLLSNSAEHKTGAAGKAHTKSVINYSECFILKIENSKTKGPQKHCNKPETVYWFVHLNAFSLFTRRPCNRS